MAGDASPLMQQPGHLPQMASVARCRLESAKNDVEKAITDTYCLPEAIILVARVAKQCTQNNRCGDTPR
jgi:hypothetical protein